MIERVLEKFGQEVHGKRVLFFPASKPSRLVVVFTGAARDRYNMWSWFYEKDEDWGETSYLFVNEDTDPKEFWWYLKEEDTYRAILQHYMKEAKAEAQHVYTIGSCMGGYGALYYGVSLSVGGVIAIRPPIRFRGQKHLAHMWVDIDRLVLEHAEQVPMIYITYSDYELDFVGAQKLLESLKDMKTITMSHPHGGKEHLSWQPSERLIKSILAFFMSLSDIPLKADASSEQGSSSLSDSRQ